MWKTIDRDATVTATGGDSTFVTIPHLSQDTIAEASQSVLGQPPRLRGNAHDHHYYDSPFRVIGQQQQQQPLRPIHVSHSCLLIPVFLAAWWYYTKQCLRKVRGLIRNSPETDESSSEKFHDKFFRVGEGHMKWEDLLDDAHTGTRTDRFVKWINRRNVRRRQAKHEMRLTSQRVLSQDTQDDSMRSNRNEGLQNDSLRSTSRNARVSTDQGSCFETTTVGSSQFLHPLTYQPSAQWECLSDAGDMELCARRHSFSDKEESESRNFVSSNFHVLSVDSSIPSTMRSESIQMVEHYIIDSDTSSLDHSRREPVPG